MPPHRLLTQLGNNVVELPIKPKTITAPPGLELACVMEQHATIAMRRNEAMLKTSRDILLEAMGDATEMVFPDGSRYVRETIHVNGAVGHDSYQALRFYGAPDHE